MEEILKIHPTHMCTPVHIHAHLCIPAHTRALSTPMRCAHLPTLPNTCPHPHTPMHNHACPCMLVLTHTPNTYPLMLTDALNLINHMKLRVNGKMTERKKERKKKEQESAEAISRLKITLFKIIFTHCSLLRMF